MLITVIKNRLRNFLVTVPGGQLVAESFFPSTLNNVCFVSASRKSEDEFWRDSPLGQSLPFWLEQPNVNAVIHFENAKGLPEIYNQHLLEDTLTDVLVFLHDDVWLNDRQLVPKILAGLRQFDVVGVAGNRRRSPFQPAWAFSQRRPDGQFIWDSEYLSGAVSHGKPGAHAQSVFGPTPQPCELMDGVFLALRAKAVREAGVVFDSRFRFDLYDMDFCRTARRQRLRLGTWPINIIHESAGDFGKDSYEQQCQMYFDKWGN